LHSDEPKDRELPKAAPQPASVFAPAAPAAINPTATERAAPQPIPAAGSSAHLYAGPGIKLKGEINGCDTLRVEGVVDGNAVARQLILCPGGSFLGTAEIDEAEIEGNFDGTLNVHGKLFLRSTGRITGTLSYGQIEIEKGGEIAGQITPNGKQPIAKPRSEQDLRSVSGERRALNAAPKPPANAVVQPIRPAPHVAAAKAPTSPPQEQSAAVAPQPASDAPVKARKVAFFGRG